MNSPEFTGERFIPGQGGAQIAYEHLHRYQFALRWAAGNRVLDVAAGIGYGAALLAGKARLVWAIDLDAASIDYARRTYARNNLLFLRGDAAALPVKSEIADLAVALEVLEHVEKQEELVAELARVVTRGGTVLISTPNKTAYSEARCYHNPFHVRELYQGEFLTLLGRYFKSVELVHQQIRAGSLIQSDNPRHKDVEIAAAPLINKPASEPMYFLALCRAGVRPQSIPRASACLDTSDGLLGEWEQRLKTAGIELDRINRDLEKMGAWCQEVGADLETRDATIRALQAEMSREIAHRDEKLAGIQNELKERACWAQDLEKGMAERDRALERMQEEIAERNRWAADLEAAVASRDVTIGHAREEFGRLEAEIAERSRWAADLEAAVASRDVTIGHAREEFGRLEAELAEREKWAQSLKAEVEARDAAIRGVQADLEAAVSSRDETIRQVREELGQVEAELAERGKWAQSLKAEVETRDSTIQSVQEEFGRLETELAERGKWAQSLKAEVEARDAAIRGVQADLEAAVSSRDETIRQVREELGQVEAELAERGKWAQSLQAEVEARDGAIKALQGELMERGRWAQGLEREIAARDVRIKEAVDELNRLAGYLDELRRRRIYRVLTRLKLFPD
jgi:SAM-dependent methyltransferase/archaellum component FlaC